MLQTSPYRETVMSAKEIEQSFVTLKQTVPLLVKHKISAVPTNYALWYTYVSNESPTLNEKLDEVVDSDLPMSEVKTKDLYRSYVSDKEEVPDFIEKKIQSA